MTPIWQENRSCPLSRFSINIYGTSCFITLCALRLHFYFLKIQKQKKNLEKVLRWKKSQPLPGTKAPAWSLTSVVRQFRPKSVSLLLLSPCLPFGFLVFLQFKCEKQQSPAQEQSMPECCRSVTGNASNCAPRSPGTALGHTCGMEPGHRDGGIFIRPEDTLHTENKWS